MNLDWETKNMKLTKVAAAVAGGLGIALGITAIPVPAATTATTVNVTATVASVCNMTAASTDVAFGTVPAFLATTQPATGSVTLTCNKGATVSIDVSNGNNFGLGQSGTLRAMKNAGTDYISYHVYQPTDAALTSCAGASTEWTTGISAAGAFSASGGPKAVSLCGVVDAAPGGGYSAGVYSDVVTVTATY